MVLFCNQPFECSKLNLPRVLLPIFKSVSVEFVLEVTGGGCYRWSASRLDIIRLTILNPDPVYGCSNRAVVASITNDLTRNTAIILAEDMNSGFVIRTDVIVDTISSLSIVTTTRELYLEEAPELFEVRAYDVQGNEFTTLEGVEFRWNLRGNAKLGEVLRFMPLEDAPYETPDSLNALNVLGKQGNIIFIEGMRTGMAKVSVDLPYSEYSHIPFTEVQLMVVTNVIIEPAVTHIIVTDTIQYRILQVTVLIGL
ncbi:hypothetical protein AAG570_013242 [Ranatra chinensis]|uniref:Uncharacterized protein n=1 Tax=Ranatra chinensis TaxID=642074 RepID=A0ABD0Z4H2_9HEMI